jgi:hypothetical protein
LGFIKFSRYCPYGDRLRYFTADGELVPTPKEANLQERQQKELALQQQEYEHQQQELALQEVEALRSKLRAAGFNPDETPRELGQG